MKDEGKPTLADWNPPGLSRLDKRFKADLKRMDSDPLASAIGMPFGIYGAPSRANHYGGLGVFYMPSLLEGIKALMDEEDKGCDCGECDQ